jgi:asparagine synthase (glutamine-hydrolysing)
MCGIAAIFAYHSGASSVNEGELVAIRDQMTARGPDGAGLWFDAKRRIGLGHRRLSIIDLSEAGAQPMLLPERQLAISFNGEIYNYRELRAALERQGHVFQSTCDTEVLLHLYAEHGPAMVNELRGMYAFALWDGVQRGLFLARDPYGIKPLYLADDGRTLRVASQVKALLAGGKIDTSPEPAGHVGFFLWGHVPEPYTLYRGIRALPAGTSLWLGTDGARKERTFCSIPELLRSASASPLRLDRGLEALGKQRKEFTQGEGPSRAERVGTSESLGQGEVSNSSADFCVSASQLSAFLKDSVAHHLIADVPVGVFLSSGLDSTTLAALAAEQGGTLRTVTLGFEEYRGTANDETPLAELVARQYGAQHRTVWVQRQDFQDQVENLFTAMDQPSCDGVNTYFVSLAAKRAGLKVALSGLGGDELFGGYPSFTQIPRSVRALGSLLPAPRIGRAFRVVTSPVLKHFTSPKYAGLLEYGGSFGGAYLLRRGMFMPWELPEILGPDLVREGWRELNTLTELALTTGPEDRGRKTEDGCPTSPWPSPSPNGPERETEGGGRRTDRLKVTALESCWYMRNQLLRDADWASMAHSLEIRVPLVDTTLLRSLLSALGSATPPTKRDLASAPRLPLPASVLNRPKTGFQIPVREWMRDPRTEDRGQRTESSARGLRGWAQEVHARFPGSDSVIARKAQSRGKKSETYNRHSTFRTPHSKIAAPSAPSLSASTGERAGVRCSTSVTCHLPPTTCNILALVTDAYGGFGGIAKFNRDLLSALCSDPAVGKVVAIPRLIPEPVGVLPDKLDYVTGAAGGKIRFALAVLRASVLRPPPSVILCGHIHLLPVAFLARRLLNFRLPSSARRPPVLLVIHGIDAWQPTGRKAPDRLAPQVDALVAVSEVTARRFMAWTELPWKKVTILPNSFDPAQFTPGPKDPALLARYGLAGRKVILTLGRLASQERYKGFDEVLEVLPELLQEDSSLVYLIVGDGSDRARLVAKAKSLGLTVSSADDRGQRAEAGSQTSEGSPPPSALRPPSPAPPSPPRPVRGQGEVSNHSAFPEAPPHVIFAGKIPEAEKVAHYRLADAYVMPSRGEGFGIVYLEALACGIPVVGSKVDGSREALRNGKLGQLVNPDDHEEIKAAIRAALQKPRGQVVAGLDYFSYANFQQRCHGLFAKLGN